MKLVSVTIKNFRGYENAVKITIDDITAFVGKNDVGKSSVLEAMDIFFNDGKGVTKIDREDVNKHCAARGECTTEISACFTDLPERIIIDAAYETTLVSEFMLNESGQLEIVKKYTNGGTPKVFIRAKHPQNPHCCDLLSKKNTELKSIIQSENIECVDRTKNAIMRAAIWQYYTDDLRLELVDIDVTKGDAKPIWGKIETLLPVFSLFQSDRKNSDSDTEIQDPLKEAVKQIISSADLQRKLDEIAAEVTEKLRDVSNRTLEKLREMAPDVADSLNPVIPPTNALKWGDVFKSVSITGDNEIPINKRGSGVRRLVLLNFFRAEAERRMRSTPERGIIYAIEEPETSQHTNNQKMLMKALIDLSTQQNTQVIVTTHSAQVVKMLGFSAIRVLSTNGEMRGLEETTAQCLPSPSYNEVNYIAFHEITEEYHNELFGYIESMGLMSSYEAGKPQYPYVRIRQNGSTVNEPCSMTRYIRHQIHHPENTHNIRFTPEQLEESILSMREFIEGLRG